MKKLFSYYRFAVCKVEILEQSLDFLYQVDKISVSGGDKNVLLLQVLAKEKEVVVFRERFFISTLKKTRVKDDEYFHRLFEFTLSELTARYLYIVISSNSSEGALNFTFSIIYGDYVGGGVRGQWVQTVKTKL